uniref:Uncharacterized protein n=1 Tax=Avena sativa TaxID=4498 RepID=A0ACD5TQN7_AVESA
MSPAGCWFPAALVWISWLGVAAGDEQQGDGGGCSAARRCGNVTISQPFWLRDRNASSCGLLDFEVSCSNGTTPVLRTSTPNGFAIVDILYGERSLRVVDVYDNSSASESSCHVPGWNTSDKLGVPFRISPRNLHLVLYNCSTAAVAGRDGGMVRMRCGNESSDAAAFVRGGGLYNGTSEYGDEAVEGCKATVVPVLGSSLGEAVANASDYERLIGGGFLLTWDSFDVGKYRTSIRSSIFCLEPRDGLDRVTPH